MNNEETNKPSWDNIMEALSLVLANNLSQTEIIDLIAILRGSSYLPQENKNG